MGRARRSGVPGRRGPGVAAAGAAPGDDGGRGPARGLRRGLLGPARADRPVRQHDDLRLGRRGAPDHRAGARCAPPAARDRPADGRALPVGRSRSVDVGALLPGRVVPGHRPPGRGADRRDGGRPVRGRAGAGGGADRHPRRDGADDGGRPAGLFPGHPSRSAGVRRRPAGRPAVGRAPDGLLGPPAHAGLAGLVDAGRARGHPAAAVGPADVPATGPAHHRPGGHRRVAGVAGRRVGAARAVLRAARGAGRPRPLNGAGGAASRGPGPTRTPRRARWRRR